MGLKCVITGCALIDEAGGKTVWGDLHKLDNNTYIFNAVLDNKGNAAWHYVVKPQWEECRAIKIKFGYDFFERRGVVVFGSNAAEFNDFALNYIGQPKFAIRLGDEP